MADATPTAPQSAPVPDAAGKRRGRGGKWMPAALFLPFAVALAPSTLVAGLCLLPSLVARLADRDPRRWLTWTVLALNLGGTLPALMTLWLQGHSFAAARWVASDPLTLLIAYGLAALGWLIHLVMPTIVTAYFGSIASARIQELRRRQAELVEVWGEEIAAEAEPGEAAAAEGPPAAPEALA